MSINHCSILLPAANIAPTRAHLGVRPASRTQFCVGISGRYLHIADEFGGCAIVPQPHVEHRHVTPTGRWPAQETARQHLHPLTPPLAVSALTDTGFHDATNERPLAHTHRRACARPSFPTSVTTDSSDAMNKNIDVVMNGHCMLTNQIGYSAKIYDASVAQYEYPNGSHWAAQNAKVAL